MQLFYQPIISSNETTLYKVSDFVALCSSESPTQHTASTSYKIYSSTKLNIRIYPYETSLQKHIAAVAFNTSNHK